MHLKEKVKKMQILTIKNCLIKIIIILLHVQKNYLTLKLGGLKVNNIFHKHIMQYKIKIILKIG